MKKILIIVLCLAFIFLGTTIVVCIRNYKLISQLEMMKTSSTKSDTVYLEKEFIPVTQYKTSQIPSMVIYYGAKDTVQLCNNSPSSESSKSDSIVQILLDKEKLTLSFQNQLSGISSTKIFDLDLGSFKYNWVDGNLTKKKVSSFSLKPYVYGNYRYFNNLLDFGGGLSFKTKSINYKLGVNTFYYPKLKSDVGFDLEFNLEYNF